VFSRLDYGSATLAGLPKQLLDRLQSATLRVLAVLGLYATVLLIGACQSGC